MQNFKRNQNIEIKKFSKAEESKEEVENMISPEKFKKSKSSNEKGQ